MSEPRVFDLIGPRWLTGYGCVACQDYHFQGDPLYHPHKWRQSKTRDDAFCQGVGP